MRYELAEIYEDPITRTKPEGTARLVRQIEPADVDGFEWWLVEFVEDDPPQPVRRKVHTNDIPAHGTGAEVA